MTIVEYLEICSQHWEDMQNLHRHDNLYDFEKVYIQMTRELARKSFEDIFGSFPADYRKKNLHDLLWQNSHRQSARAFKSPNRI